MIPIICPSCRISVSKYKETIIKDSLDKYRIRGACPKCNCYIKWVAFRESQLPQETILMMENHNRTIAKKMLNPRTGEVW